MHDCPRGYGKVAYIDCMMCVNDNSTEQTCGACEDVKNSKALFTCKDCRHPNCPFSGNREMVVCYMCLKETSEKTGYWGKFGNESILFCSQACDEQYRKNRQSKQFRVNS